MAELCPECLRGFFCGQCAVKRDSELDEDLRVNRDNGSGLSVDTSREESSGTFSRRTRRHKPDRAIKDQQSTGRKRAAIAYPLDRDADCEWKNASPSNPCGGGNPVTFGCKDGVGLQQARHHGPDKNTLNNEPGNVHRVCHYHHNNWHALNDPDYDWSQHNKPRRD